AERHRSGLVRECNDVLWLLVFAELEIASSKAGDDGAALICHGYRHQYEVGIYPKHGPIFRPWSGAIEELLGSSAVTGEETQHRDMARDRSWSQPGAHEYLTAG